MLNKLLNKFLKPEVYNLHQFYEKNQWLSKEELEKYQINKLQKLIEYSYNNVLFYKNLWNKKNIDIKIYSLKDLEKFPIVDKSMLQEAIKNNEISKEYIDKLKTNQIVWQSTTGSSGKPFKFPVDILSENHKDGLRRRLYKWYGIDYGIKWAKFWRGSYKKSFKEKVKEYLTGQYKFCIYDPKYPKETELNESRIKSFIIELNRIKPSVIDGFPSALIEISNYIMKNNIELEFKVESIVTGAELLTLEDRKIISKAFDATVFNRYGGTESSIIAHECEYQAKNEHFLHIQDDRLIVELDENNELIFTDLTTYSLPFIRYKNGDLGTIDKEYKCPCGRNLTMLTSIKGRVNDMFLLPDGGKISSHIWQNYMKKCEGIEKYQMIQEKIDLVIINWIKNSDLFHENEFVYVQNLIQNALKECQIVWNEVNKIEVGIGGKFRQHICKVKN